MSRPCPEIIAEIGVNYYDIARKENISPLAAAKRMARAARDAGAAVAKFQTYKAEKLAAELSPAYWDTREEPTRSQRALFSKFDKLTAGDYQDIAAYCRKIGIEFMSTPFDKESARQIDPLVKRHKVASADLTHLDLLSLIGSFHKPVLLSTGASKIGEIRMAVNLLKKSGAKSVTLLHCVLCYPTPPAQANLWRIQALRRDFSGLDVGYSDHTKFSLDVLSAAYLLGASVIEKHFTLDKSLKGNDHYHAADPDDLRALVDRWGFLSSALGREQPDSYDPSEETARRYARRGVYLVSDVKAGRKVRREDVEFLRPLMNGMTCQQWEDALRKGLFYSKDFGRSRLLRPGDLVKTRRRPSASPAGR